GDVCELAFERERVSVERERPEPPPDDAEVVRAALALVFALAFTVPTTPSAGRTTGASALAFTLPFALSVVVPTLTGTTASLGCWTMIGGAAPGAPGAKGVDEGATWLRVRAIASAVSLSSLTLSSCPPTG